jgi:hypothetical protein
MPGQFPLSNSVRGSAVCLQPSTSQDLFLKPADHWAKDRPILNPISRPNVSLFCILAIVCYTIYIPVKPTTVLLNLNVESYPKIILETYTIL